MTDALSPADPYLASLLVDLDDRERACVQLRYSAGLTDREISEVLCLSAAGLSHVLAKALRKVARVVEASAPGLHAGDYPADMNHHLTNGVRR